MGTPSDNRLPKDTTTGIPISQAQLFGENNSGIVEPLSQANPMPMAGVSLSVSRGLVPGQASFEKFGRSTGFSSGTAPEDLWNGAGIYTGFPTGAAETIEVFSSSNNDGAGTLTGLLTIRLFGQLAGVEQTEDVVLTGTTPAVTTKLWDRMPRVRGLTAGSVGSNIGTITARHTITTANVFAVMPIGANRTQIAAFTVPAGKTMYLKLFDPRLVLAAGVAASGTMAIIVRENGGVWEQTNTLDLTSGGAAPLPADHMVKYPALTDVVARKLDASSGSMSGTAQFFGVLVDD